MQRRSAKKHHVVTRRYQGVVLVVGGRNREVEKDEGCDGNRVPEPRKRLYAWILDGYDTRSVLVDAQILMAHHHSRNGDFDGAPSLLKRRL